jgi:hypothetical protein
MAHLFTGGPEVVTVHKTNLCKVYTLVNSMCRRGCEITTFKDSRRILIDYGYELIDIDPRTAARVLRRARNGGVIEYFEHVK